MFCFWGHFNLKFHLPQSRASRYLQLQFEKERKSIQMRGKSREGLLLSYLVLVHRMMEPTPTAYCSPFSLCWRPSQQFSLRRFDTKQWSYTSWSHGTYQLQSPSLRGRLHFGISFGLYRNLSRSKDSFRRWESVAFNLSHFKVAWWKFCLNITNHSIESNSKKK